LEDENILRPKRKDIMTEDNIVFTEGDAADVFSKNTE
jgi:hypothetical protein